VDDVQHSDRNLLAIASLTASLNVDGHRSDLVILKAARAHAALEGRTHLTDLDIARAAELALPHRMKGGPLQQNDIGVDEISGQLEQLVGQEGERSQPSDKQEGPPQGQDSPKKV